MKKPLNKKEIVRLTEDFIKSGGSVIKLPDSATTFFPETMPLECRDKYIEHRHSNAAPRAKQFYLTVRQVHKIEEMIERREKIDAVARELKMTGRSLADIAHKMKVNGIKFPDYLKKE